MNDNLYIYTILCLHTPQVERFKEQFAAIMAAFLDDRLKRNSDAKKLERLSDADMTKLDDFIDLMKVMYQCTLTLSSESKPTAALILPIIGKLEKKFKVTQTDTEFVKSLKKAVWDNLKTRYLVCLLLCSSLLCSVFQIF